jgi:hypothetical protein
MLQLHSENKEHVKRAHALRLIFKQAELGFGDVPRSYRELQEKVASLLTQDLVIVEKALELTGGNMKLGELDRTDLSASPDATEQFQAAIME